MAKVQIPYFDEIDMTSVEDYYCVDAQIGQLNVKLDINFPEKTTKKVTVEKIINFIERIEETHKNNIKEYREDFNSEGETAEHIEFYLEELFEEQLSELVDISQSHKNQKLQMLDRLDLIRVGIYPSEKNEESEHGYFGVFDYSIKFDGEYSNQLLVVNVKLNGNLCNIDWES